MIEEGRGKSSCGRRLAVSYPWEAVTISLEEKGARLM